MMVEILRRRLVDGKIKLSVEMVDTYETPSHDKGDRQGDLGRRKHKEDMPQIRGGDIDIL